MLFRSLFLLSSKSRTRSSSGSAAPTSRRNQPTRPKWMTGGQWALATGRRGLLPPYAKFKVTGSAGVDGRRWGTARGSKRGEEVGLPECQTFNTEYSEARLNGGIMGTWCKHAICVFTLSPDLRYAPCFLCADLPLIVSLTRSQRSLLRCLHPTEESDPRPCVDRKSVV